MLMIFSHVVMLLIFVATSIKMYKLHSRCSDNYQQACTKRNHVGIVFTQWFKNRLFAMSNFTFIGQKCGNTEPKLSKF